MVGLNALQHLQLTALHIHLSQAGCRSEHFVLLYLYLKLRLCIAAAARHVYNKNHF